jgi:hypothetical protein
MCRLLQPSQDAARHPSKRWIPSFVRREEAPECIYVVTADNCAFRRQFVNEMRVTVIDDVKQIELTLNTPQFARVVDETSEEASEQVRL